jgi:predicted pyridoxine 5'-phosphate oxidase superfamily flavin-nucleotide-binding protein
MVMMPLQVREFLPGKLAWVATAASDGTPNATPKGSLRVLDDQHVLFVDLHSLNTRQNLEQNPKVAVTVIDPATHAGFQIKGTAEIIVSGALYEQEVLELWRKSRALPRPKAVVKIHVEAIYYLSAGPTAGQQIA